MRTFRAAWSDPDLGPVIHVWAVFLGLTLVALAAYNGCVR